MPPMTVPVAQRFYATAFWISMAIAMAILMAGVLIWGHIDWASVLHTHDPGHYSRGCALCRHCLCIFSPEPPLNLIHRVLSGYQQTQITNYFNLTSNVLGLGSILLVIWLHGSLPQLMFVYSSTLLASTVALNVWVVLWDKRWLLPRPGVVSRGVVSELMNSGFGFFVLQLAGLIVFNSDNVVITHYLGAAEVTPYSVVWRLAATLRSFRRPFFPRFGPHTPKRMPEASMPGFVALSGTSPASAWEPPPPPSLSWPSSADRSSAGTSVPRRFRA